MTFNPKLYTINKCSIPQMNLWPKEKYYQYKKDINLPKCQQTTLFKTNNSLKKIISIHEYLTISMGKLIIHKSIINNNNNNNNNLIICSLFPIKRLNDYQSIYLNSIEQINNDSQLNWSMFMIICQLKQNILLNEITLNDNNTKSNQIERLFICGSYRPIEQIKQLKQSLYRKKYDSQSMFNVLLLGIDSMSRLSAYRYLIKTIQFLQTINNSAVIMNLYNVIGDGTTVNLLGLLTGQLEIELPESRKSHIHMMSKDNLILNNNDNHTVLDDYPWIWKEFSEYSDYVTHYIEDTPKWGTFQHRLCGFGSFNSPTTSYGRPCLIAASQEERYTEKILGCTMSRYTHQVLLESLTEFFTTYSDKPRFSLTFLSELIHENPAYGKLIDEDLVKLIQRIYYEDQMFNNRIPGKFSYSDYPFANTLVILFSDHGPRMGDARLSVQGRLEERLPFMSIIAPKQLQEKWSSKWFNVQSNQNRLITLFDIHATLRDLLINQLKIKNVNNEKLQKIYLNWQNNPSHGLSLFHRIPLNRNCNDAFISSHWCVCLNWIKLDDDDNNSNEFILKSTNAIIKKINEMIIKYKPYSTKNGECSMITLYKIKSVEQAILPQDTVRFIRSQDEDGRIPMFQEKHSSTWSPLDWIKQFNIFRSINNNGINSNILDGDFIHGIILLRIHIIVQPEFAHFEATVEVNTTTFHSLDAFHVTDISRIDVYEQHNWCLSDDNEWAETKQYCICRKHT
ncbi:hypothetical protein MN116_002133 [Schistosoma mekongi]|uniref:Uncharacterized protein n=1 Tax=Schistosoma mekongi TaxID=38744 RepID=A0AAE1ZJH3_SCHME|nr:hypothetical protein MN116_002133 [Schistosoma mekongi]